MQFSINAQAVQGFSLMQVRACLRLEPLSLKLNGSRCGLAYGLPCGLLYVLPYGFHYGLLCGCCNCHRPPLRTQSSPGPSATPCHRVLPSGAAIASWRFSFKLHVEMRIEIEPDLEPGKPGPCVSRGTASRGPRLRMHRSVDPLVHLEVHLELPLND